MKSYHMKGFNLIELMITVAIIGILASIALPSYKNYIIKSSRTAAQTELIELASIQEKIYLNSNAYTTSVTTAYDGTSAGGLARTSGQTTDNKYNLSISSSVPYQTFTITATPVATLSQNGDGNLTISQNGIRLWGTANW
jgi:type IV pilus assembly protein PilE